MSVRRSDTGVIGHDRGSWRIESPGGQDERDELGDLPLRVHDEEVGVELGMSKDGLDQLRRRL